MSIFFKSGKNYKNNIKRSAENGRRAARFEALEDRQMLSVTNVMPAQFVQEAPAAEYSDLSTAQATTDIVNLAGAVLCTGDAGSYSLVVNSEDDGPVDHSDDDVKVTLRDAVDALNQTTTASAADRISTFADSVEKVTLTEGDLDLNGFSFTIDGTRTGDLANVTIDCNFNSRAFDIYGGPESTDSQYNQKLNFKNLQFVNGNVEDSQDHDANGGTILFASNNSQVSFNGVDIANSHADGNGGAIALYNTAFKAKATTFSGNTSGIEGVLTYGGAVYAEQQGLNLQSNVKFVNNSAIAGNGGAIALLGSDNLKGSVSITGSGIEFKNNAAIDGGAVYSYNPNPRSGIITNCVLASMGTVTFEGNTAVNNGGAVYLGKQEMVQAGGYANYYFKENQAGGDGGAIYCGDYNGASIQNSSKAEFTKNVAGGRGGAVYGGITSDSSSSFVVNGNTASIGGGV